MQLNLWQVDAFSEKALGGNPAAIVPLSAWIDDALMQKIANENNLAETAFFVKMERGRYGLRWFTPAAEVELCGHATLASAWLLFDRLDPELTTVSFETRSGILTVARGRDGWHVMSLPSDPIVPLAAECVAAEIGEALGCVPPAELFKGRYLVAVWDDPAEIHALKGPGDIAGVLRKVGFWGLIATSKGSEGYDFISRFFAPDKAVPEDPVTGSAHCALTPFWAHRLGKKALKARQVSPRGGDLICTDEGERTILSGPCALYMTAEIAV
jgi:predicted PhzF superfamily epimerase YddE/YHI9